MFGYLKLESKVDALLARVQVIEERSHAARLREKLQAAYGEVAALADLRGALTRALAPVLTGDPDEPPTDEQLLTLVRSLVGAVRAAAPEPCQACGQHGGHAPECAATRFDPPGRAGLDVLRRRSFGDAVRYTLRVPADMPDEDVIAELTLRLFEPEADRYRHALEWIAQPACYEESGPDGDERTCRDAAPGAPAAWCSGCIATDVLAAHPVPAEPARPKPSAERDYAMESYYEQMDDADPDQDDVEDWLIERYGPTRDLAAQAEKSREEVNEMAAAVDGVLGVSAEPEPAEGWGQNLRDEAADVVITCMAIAVTQGFDLNEAVKQKWWRRKRGPAKSTQGDTEEARR